VSGGRPLTISEAKAIAEPVIYGLCGIDGLIFYVGQTKSPRYRFASHKQNNGRNRRLREKIDGLGGDLRVIVLDRSPVDLNAAERREISARAGCIVNLIGADSSVWSLHSDKPWAAGTGVKSPMSYAMAAARPEVKAVMRKKLSQMSDAARCQMEIRMLLSFCDGLQLQFAKWLYLTADKMEACIANG
jgi:hypothetical protein